ncbi:hypothetical protein [Brevibacterium zhoupengii]|uniref:hypothetical protein n=1 Tax=Brevibacterium zhoupengii TaxID=2898795 RepID=UPI001F09A371|nr:hypothetical protein [Brevibacterium zhoupengii]
MTLIGVVALSSSLVACGGGPQEVDADENDQSQGNDAEDENDQSQGSDAGDDKISIASISADNIAGICLQEFGEIEDVFKKLDLDVPENTEFGFSDDRYQEGGGWADEYFPDDNGFSNEGSDNGTIRCQAHAFYENDSGSKEDLGIDISFTGGDEEPRGNTDFTVSADGMTAGIRSSTRSGSGMHETSENEVVEQSVGEQFITDNVLPKFKP